MNRLFETAKRDVFWKNMFGVCLKCSLISLIFNIGAFLLQEVGVDHDDLNHVEIQALIEYVNAEVQEENDRKS